MDISRNNYQNWITDFYDGTLDIRSQDLLMEFLEKNSDLKAEFDDWANLTLYPDISQRTGKESLKKDLNSLEDDQIERFVIAYIENDLSGNQKDEISQIIKENERFSVFYNSYTRLKLEPSSCSYPGKRTLKMIPYRKRIRRIALGSLSAAASVVLIIALSLIFKTNVQDQVIFDSSALGSILFAPPDSESTNLELYKTLIKSKAVLKSIPESRETSIDITADLTGTGAGREEIHIDPLNYSSAIALAIQTVPCLLAEAALEDEPAPEFPETLSPRQFIAKNFREIILNEEEGGIEKLKVYEVADAGIRGMNKLLGWEMNLEKDVAGDGHLNNIKFTSELINFDHKPKKNGE